MISYELAEPFANMPELHQVGPRDAPVLLLANSLGTNIQLWDAQVDHWCRTRRVVRFDYPGHAGACWTCAPGMAGIAAALTRALDAAEISTFDFCGISMGGALGMELALTLPRRVRRLVLSNTAPAFATPAFWEQRQEIARLHGVAALAQPTVARWLTPVHAAAEPLLVDWLLHMFATTTLDGYLRCSQDVADFDALERLGAIAVPTLVISGAHDLATPPGLGRQLQQAIPAARHAELDAAHLGHLGASAAFQAEVDAFFS